MAEGRSMKDLVLSPNQFAYILDRTKGNVATYVGPYKTSLSETDAPVIFDPYTKNFIEKSLNEALQQFVTAPEGWYIILKNPTKDNKYPAIKSNNDLVDLMVGKKINIPGPTSFALYPGQMSYVIKGHNLRSNQYLVVEIYDEVAAQAYWGKGIMKPVDGETEDSFSSFDVKDFVTGKQFIIKGTEISFYIPPTGVRVVPDDEGNYVRDAVTLERLEYCILINEDGNKRYTHGPAVVFPTPTETFLKKTNSRKFRSIELTPTSGIFVKIIADYVENDVEFKAGTELFITGNDTMIYYPRSEHVIISYANQSIIHYAVAIPKGEARYVLNKLTGEIKTVKGPCMFLPDPRKEVIVRRILTDNQSNLWFPGNTEALLYNRKLDEIRTILNNQGAYVENYQFLESVASTVPSKKTNNPKLASTEVSYTMSNAIVGDEFKRNNAFTPPRTITLDTKYEGAVGIQVWTGYAVQVIGKDSSRDVIVGPATRILNYDETLEVLELSSGKPKSTDDLIKTAYLRINNNKISDIIRAETSDICPIDIKISLTANFIGDPSKWFATENYIKLVCDKIRSILRAKIKTISIEEFYANSSEIVRNTILHSIVNNNDLKGLFFEENNILVSDVDVLGIEIKDTGIAKLLIDSRREMAMKRLEFEKLQNQHELNQKMDELKIDLVNSELTVQNTIAESKNQQLRNQLELDSIETQRKLTLIREKIENDKAVQVVQNEIQELARKSKELDAELTASIQEKAIEQQKTILEAQTLAIVEQTKAITPNLVQALQTLGDVQLIKDATEKLAPLAIIRDSSVLETLKQLMDGNGLLGQSIFKDK